MISGGLRQKVRRAERPQTGVQPPFMYSTSQSPERATDSQRHAFCHPFGVLFFLYPLRRGCTPACVMSSPSGTFFPCGYQRPVTKKSEGLKDHRRGCNPRSCNRQAKALKGRQTICGTHSVTPSGFCFISILCAGVAPLPVLCRPRRGLFALVVIGGLKGQHAASPGHRPGEHGNTLSTGQQTATTRPHPDRDTKKTSRPLKEHP